MWRLKADLTHRPAVDRNRCTMSVRFSRLQIVELHNTRNLDQCWGKFASSQKFFGLRVAFRHPIIFIGVTCTKNDLKEKRKKYFARLTPAVYRVRSAGSFESKNLTVHNKSLQQSCPIPTAKNKNFTFDRNSIIHVKLFVLTEFKRDNVRWRFK